MAKVNKKAFHCIPLAVFTDNGHSTLSPKFERRKNRLLCPISLASVRHLTGTGLTSLETEMAHSSRITWGLYFAPLPSPPLRSPVSSPLPANFCMSSSFPPSDIPGGFSVIQEAEPTEGGCLNLTCVANRHLYTALSWQRLHHRESFLSSHQLTSGEYSNFLVLSIGNLSASHSGVYRCSARHRVSGTESHLDTRVAVTSEWFDLTQLLPQCRWIS